MRSLIVILSWLLLLSCGEKKVNQQRAFLGDWEFKNQKDSSWYPAKVPGEVHLDLFRNELIENPYQNNNELDQQWIEKEDWEYRSEWSVDADLLNNDHIVLEFEGLDTYSKVYLNDSLVLETENMFRTYRVEVKTFLHSGLNTVRVAFTSPLNRNKEKVENYPYKLPSGNETGSLQVSSFTRKAAYQFGWDWGPRLIGAGIWRPLNIITWSEYRLEDVFISTKSITENEAIMEVQISIQSDVSRSETIKIDNESYSISLVPGKNEFTFPIRIANPALWWSNGFGEQALQEMEVKLLDELTVIDQKNVTYGIRTVELINEPDSIGTSYYFRVNGEPIFMKGANYIPQDIFPSRVSEEQYRKLIDKVKAANMNMLRVWGGGIYEDDLFYELCDQNGILIWQDFMFAGSMYPSDSSFHQNVVEEVKDNVRRLRSHPSIALWCGNNEIEVAWKNWGWQNQFGYSTEDSIKIWENYVKLFQDEIPSVLESLSPDLDYVTTSPLSNWGTPENFNHGSMHYWGVWHGKEPLENYQTNVGRFMSEYGFQSFPSLKSLASVIDSTELHLDSEVISNRQKSYIGNDMITQIARQHFGEAIDFEDYILKSQQTQALAMKIAIQAHRLNKPHCMGTLFWQLNGVWQGPSWSVLEYDDTSKLAFEEIEKWYQSIVVIPKINGSTIDLHIVSDRLASVSLKMIVTTAEQKFEKQIALKHNANFKALTIEKTSAYAVQLIENGMIIFEDSSTFSTSSFLED